MKLLTFAHRGEARGFVGDLRRSGRGQRRSVATAVRALRRLDQGRYDRPGGDTFLHHARQPGRGRSVPGQGVGRAAGVWLS